MKYLTSSLCLVLIIATAPTVRAVDSLTDAQLNAIVANCVDAQISLQRVQQADKPTRINRGYLYDTLLKLMVNFNTRAAQNRIDSPDLLSVASKFEQEVKQFTQTYTAYDDAVTAIGSISCKESPTDFYDQLVRIRTQRAQLNKSVTTLDSYLDTYAQSVKYVRETVVPAGEDHTQ